jgi:hypothetical protein
VATTFKDRYGREWSIEIDTSAIRRVAARFDGLRIDRLFDRLCEGDHTGWCGLIDDVLRLCDLLWVLVEPEAVKRGVSDEEFGRGLVGSHLDAAAVALQRAMETFTPRQERVSVGTSLLAKRRELETKAVELSLKEISEIQLSKPATGAAESSESTPAGPA